MNNNNPHRGRIPPVSPSVPVHLGEIQHDLKHVRASVPAGSMAWFLADIAIQAVTGALKEVAPKAYTGDSVTRNELPPALSLEIAVDSPVVGRLPSLLEVHRLALHLHRTLLETGDRLPVILSGWVVTDTKGYLDEARRNLENALKTVQAGGAL
jgi:hypothetical protein